MTFGCIKASFRGICCGEHGMSALHMQVSVGSSWADFADALALSKLGSVRIEGCSLASATEGASQQPDALVKHIDTLLDNVFQVLTLFLDRLK